MSLKCSAFLLATTLQLTSMVCCAQSTRSIAAPAPAIDATPTRGGLGLSGAIPRATETKRVALVIGNGNYQHLAKLPNPANDAKDMCNALSALNFEVFCQTDVANRNQLRSLVRNFSSQLTPNSLALFYYAGHGIQISGENYLLPLTIDAKSTADIEDEGLNLSFVLRTLEDARSIPNIVVLDACRNNPFAQRIAGTAKGLARIEPPPGTVLVYATSPNGVAIDGSGRNGLFTKHLLNNLQHPGRKLDELFQLVAHDVEMEARNLYRFEQTPFRSSSFSGGYCLAGCDAPDIAQQIDKFKQERDEAQRQVEKLISENRSLNQRFSENSAHVASLEDRIKSLSREIEVSNANNSSSKTVAVLTDELERTKAEFRKATENNRLAESRGDEIKRLSSLILESEKKITELENYKSRVRELEEINSAQAVIVSKLKSIQQESEAAEIKIKSLTDENNKLKNAFDQREQNIRQMEAQIEVLKSSKTHDNKQMEKLVASVEMAKREKLAAQGVLNVATERETEIAKLKQQLLNFEEQSKHLEDYKNQIENLKRQNSEKARLLSSQSIEKARSQIVIPSF